MRQYEYDFDLLVLNMVIHDAIYGELPSFWKVGPMILGRVYRLRVKWWVLTDGLVFFCLILEC